MQNIKKLAEDSILEIQNWDKFITIIRLGKYYWITR